MTDFYIKFKLWMDYIIPIILIALIFIISFLAISVQYNKQKRVEKFFLKHGYKRKLFDVASVGDKSFYGWVRETDNKRVDDRDLRGLKFKTIKERYK